MTMLGTQPTIPTDEAQFLWAIRQQESGGNYKDVNQSSGALGAYQIMPANLSAWETDAGVAQMSGTQFLNNSAEQDAVAVKILGGYYNKYGPEGAAAMWYSGQPNPNSNVGTPPVSTYVNDVMQLMNGAPTTNLPGGSGVQATTTSVEGDIGSSVLSGILSAFGIDDLGDLMERLGLILLGGMLIIIAVMKLTNAKENIEKGAKVAAEAGVMA